MNVSGLLTSAGINIAICTVLASLYSILRKQPGNLNVYFGQRLAQVQSIHRDSFSFDRLVPSASWIVKAWEATEEEILTIGGVDAVVFFRIVVFSIRIFSLAAVICLFLVLPLNYFGQHIKHKKIPTESLEVFTIVNIQEGSRWLWAHCLALYAISCCACVLLYLEYKSITKMRLAYITGSHQNLSHFTVLVRAIPWSGESYSGSVTKFFTNYYASSYISHKMVYLPGAVQKIVKEAEKMYKMVNPALMTKNCGSSFMRCGLCGVAGNSFKILSKEAEMTGARPDFVEDLRDKECAVALVFFRTRYAALVAAQTLQSPEPMLWITDLAPEPQDVCWTSLCVPYRLLWARKIGITVAAIVFMGFFLVPVSLVQGLVHLDKLKEKFSFVKKLSEDRNIIFDMITGYLPSVMLMIFLYTVPPIMTTLSALEGAISRSGRKKSACQKVLYFLIWNVFFANIMSGTVMDKLDRFSSLKDFPRELGKGVPSMVVFFMTYILTSGWASLACELMQPFVLICHWLDRCLFRGRVVLSYGLVTFPYHTEIPRVLLFGLLGFTTSVTAPLVLPFLLVYFFLAYLVYRNQFLNVYITKYQTGGLYWPIAHNATIFSLVLMQLIVLGVFGLKRSPVTSGFTILLIFCTLLFNVYCRQKFLPIFRNTPAQVLMELDRHDEQSGMLEEIHDKLSSAYCQFNSSSKENINGCHLDPREHDGHLFQNPEDRIPVR